MADEEQFSLCWNNFNTNLSAGFHESLCRGDLVDVTLAAEGQLVKAHRLVLSVCSPYFRKMFTQMPANQHAFVFLKDVSSSALKDLIQFMYCGEVNVKQEALPAFISTAEALQIKGLTESNDGTVTAQGSSSPTKEGNVSTPLPDQSSLRPRSTRIVASRPQAFKIESEGSSDEKQTVTLVQTTQPSKRSSRQSITVAPKRIKMSQSQESADPLDDPEHEIVTPQHLKVTEATEFIDLPIEGTQLNPKTEPEYVEDTQEIETEQDDDQYVEDVTYGEEKYDESYFTEGDDKAGVSGFSETYATEGDQSNTDAQELSNLKYAAQKAEEYKIVDRREMWPFIRSQRGAPLILHSGFIYRCERKIASRTYWLCIRYKGLKCNARLILKGNNVCKETDHNHQVDERAVEVNVEFKNLNDSNLDEWFKASSNTSKEINETNVERSSKVDK
ncbi:CLUMA_CG005563, isoform E [Clunio marinus]|uniref:CLUMA_CG005563, isoform E n=1 Tax=Clunio marinus TaxID=568069 RepID=A0A1J1HWR5_9DIPT|nr:CLUMA_CG005563, isoform E [Clunio marinus]